MLTRTLSLTQAYVDDVEAAPPVVDRDGRPVDAEMQPQPSCCALADAPREGAPQLPPQRTQQLTVLEPAPRAARTQHAPVGDGYGI